MPRHNHDGTTEIEDNDNIYYDVQAEPSYFVSTTQKYIGNTTRFLHVRRSEWESCTTCQHKHSIKSSGENQSHSYVATSSKISLSPSFYALVYIMKL
ncbi:unnamed protein product [Adineta steineri]|uniref:Uncharacterized protein n=2 Tax=Adineta steineri TaxID=433720 RepID=A0A815F3N9_9BILA|nr:unnamed protein product [Adineta steineri]CAF4031861.1 unnamed protein product [Adineta steineri]